MKKLIVLFSVIISVYSCSSDDNSSNEVVELDVTVSNTDKYEYDLGSFGDEEGARIHIQARHFETSVLGRDLNTSRILYKYKSTAGYVGTDYVEIYSERGSDGASPNTEISIAKINITITD